MFRQLAGRVLLQQQPSWGARVRPAASVRMAVRRMGGGASGAPHPSQPTKAYLFNQAPGQHKAEAWEHITAVVYWSTLFILVTGLYYSPETRIKEWAAEEAEARVKRLEDGKPIEYGKYYHKQLLAWGYKPSHVGTHDLAQEEIEDEEEEE